MQSEDINRDSFAVVVCVFAFDITGEIIEFQIDCASQQTNERLLHSASPAPSTTPSSSRRRLLGNFIKVRRRRLRSNRFPFRLCFCKFYVVRKLNFIGLLPFAEAPPSPPPGQSDCCHRMNVRATSSH